MFSSLWGLRKETPKQVDFSSKDNPRINCLRLLRVTFTTLMNQGSKQCCSNQERLSAYLIFNPIA